ncbi:hypothetical protein SSEA_SKINNY_97 [Mycobacterium phage Skinny]|uniref:Uncharacterized protein n=5 Tax=Bongovirus bongo TaxID=1983750 RepID=A0A0M4QUF6_9CAUD|nr:hypothetical protein PEGLEG_94 [Mycobacterium phage PegLeg]ALF00618.1 hypothetical protein SEA_BRICOLE_92 [Mycobacterium phage Bricole]AXQ52731.1 hypothetical protein SEA_IPHANE7_92 [Mycobacterium phage IPhane7]QDH93665.1 hypothetical protein SEA_LILHOMIEP_93 [Mycobacterium phage LilhomieP]QGJ93285.1 hypothetical protein SEA_TYDAWG_93 [Mycobacterium phage TyDawg]QUU29293.1 hypothetical protein [Mycobacterium phage SirSheldon]UXE05287.1 hypothetical protein SSEA_SKINNY_97 [Mycobacterium pha
MPKSQRVTDEQPVGRKELESEAWQPTAGSMTDLAWTTVHNAVEGESE